VPHSLPLWEMRTPPTARTYGTDATGPQYSLDCMRTLQSSENGSLCCLKRLRRGHGFFPRTNTHKLTPLMDEFCVVPPTQIATTGLLSTTYVHKVSDKVSLATEFLWNWNSREATASVGCVPARYHPRLSIDGCGVR
jgi:hypothetical protein